MTINAGAVVSTLTADSSKFVAAYKQAQQAMARTGAELAAAKAAMANAAGPTDELKKKIEDLKKAMLSNQAATAQAKVAMADMGGAGASASQTLNAIKGRLSNVVSAMNAFAGAAGAAGGEVGKIGSAAANVFGAAAAGGIWGVAMAAGGAAITALAGHVMEAREKIAADLRAIGEKGQEHLAAVKKDVDDLGAALRNFGKSAAAARSSDADNKLGYALDLQNRAASDMNDLLGREKAIRKQILDLELKGAQWQTAGLRADLERNREAQNLIKARSATIDQDVAYAQRASNMARDLLEKERAANRQREGAADALEKIKEANEKNKKVAQDQVALAAKKNDHLRETLDLYYKLGSAGALSASSVVPGGAGAIIAGLGESPKAPFADVMDASADEIAMIGEVSGEQVTVIRDTTGELMDMGRQALANITSFEGHRRAVDAASEALSIAFSRENLAKTIGGIAGNLAALGKGGGAAAGTQVGAIIGGVVDVASGGATAGMGAALGGILGGIFGESLDKLVDALGVLTPLFEAVGDIIDTLTPVLLAIKTGFQGVRDIIQIGVVGTFRDLGKVVGPVFRVFAELFIALAPWIGLVVKIVMSFLTMAPVLSLVSTLLQRVANWANALAQASRGLWNTFADWNNAMINLIRTLPGQKNYGTKLDHIGAVEERYGDKKRAIEEAKDAARKNRDALKENTEALRAQTNNLPSGYKGFNNSRFSAAPVVQYFSVAASEMNAATRRIAKAAADGTIFDSVSARGLGDQKG